MLLFYTSYFLLFPPLSTVELQGIPLDSFSLTLFATLCIITCTVSFLFSNAWRCKRPPPSGLRDGVIGGILWRDRVIRHIFWRDGVIKILA